MKVQIYAFMAAVALVLSAAACDASSTPVVETPRAENTRVPSVTVIPRAENTLIPTATAIPTQEIKNQTSTLAFASDRDNAAGIYLATLDGTISPLTHEKYEASHPAWSPDGKHIAFDARVNGREEMFVMNSDGSNVKQLTREQGDNFYPSWSPDSQQLALASNREGTYQIYLMRADGSDVRRLTKGNERAEKPAWSPDGTEIAYMLQVGGNVDIYATRIDGSNTRRLTTHAASDFNPAWSPDGKQIAFNSSRAGEHQIFVMNADGKNVAQLTNARGWSEKPAWSPDGKQIAFYSNRDGNAEIYVMDASGENVQRLTNASGFDGQPTWMPLKTADTLPTRWDVYDSAPQHLWNRIFRHFYGREVNGKVYGRDALDPLLWHETKYLLEGKSHTRAVELLDEFLSARGETFIHDPLKRAMFQRDLWAVFDWTATESNLYSEQRRALQTRLAQVIHRVALSDAEIRALPDNYAQAVAAGAFPPNYQTEKPLTAFLPPMLFNPESEWVMLGREGGPIAMTHTESFPFTGRSVFLVFLRAPNGRAETQSLLAQLDDRTRPPLLPVGTEVALVRRMLLINDVGGMVLSPLVESVQLRHFYKANAQHFFEFKLDRDALFAGERGGLVAMQPDEKDLMLFQMHGVDVFEIDPQQVEASQGTVLKTCESCHFLRVKTGAQSIISYSRSPFPLSNKSVPVLIETTAEQEAQKVMDWKHAQESWRALK